VTSGQLLRAARLRAGLSQYQLAERTGTPRSQIARWETDAVEPGLSTLRRQLHACGFDLALDLIPYAPDAAAEARLEQLALLTPHQRLDQMLRERDGG
jgi:transcriptional regulator with XRE-family HTH domain